MLIFIVREKRHKNYSHRERERVSRVKEATTYHFVFDYEKCGFYSGGKTRGTKKGGAEINPTP
jgi:hypothetical protein